MCVCVCACVCVCGLCVCLKVSLRSYVPVAAVDFGRVMNTEAASAEAILSNASRVGGAAVAAPAANNNNSSNRLGNVKSDPLICNYDNNNHNNN